MPGLYGRLARPCDTNSIKIIKSQPTDDLFFSFTTCEADWPDNQNKMLNAEHFPREKKTPNAMNTGWQVSKMLSQSITSTLCVW